jgi:CheY-like chemotaxis protein
VKRVLITEDDLLVRYILVTIFEDLGWGVREAASGDEALRLLCGGVETDLLFTDIHMPGRLDGWALAEEARSLRPDLPIIYCSGYSFEAHRQVPKSMHIQKPCRATTISSALKDLGMNDR